MGLPLHLWKRASSVWAVAALCAPKASLGRLHLVKHAIGWRMWRWGWDLGDGGTHPLRLVSLQYPVSLSPSRFYPVTRRVPEYYGPYSSQYPDDYQYYPPGVRPDSICSMPAYDRISPPWALEDKRHSFRNGGGPAFQLREWKEPAGYGRQDSTVWIPSPSRQPVYYDELDATSGSLRHLSLQPRSHSVPRSPGQGSCNRARIYSPVRSPSARFERLPPRSEDIYADPAAYVMRRSISSPKVSHQPAPPPSSPEVPQKPETPAEKRWLCAASWIQGHCAVCGQGQRCCPESQWPCDSIHRRAALGPLLCPLSRNMALCARPQVMPGTLIPYNGGRQGSVFSDLEDLDRSLPGYCSEQMLSIVVWTLLWDGIQTSLTLSFSWWGSLCPSRTPSPPILFLFQYDYLGDRRPVPAGLFPYNYPPSPTVHDKMVCPLHSTPPTSPPRARPTRADQGCSVPNA